MRMYAAVFKTAVVVDGDIIRPPVAAATLASWQRRLWCVFLSCILLTEFARLLFQSKSRKPAVLELRAVDIRVFLSPRAVVGKWRDRCREM